MICPCAKKGETSVVDSRPTEDGTAIRCAAQGVRAGHRPGQTAVPG